MESPFGFIKGFQLEQKVHIDVHTRQHNFDANRDTTLAAELNLPPQMAQTLQGIEVKE
jgi:hypothetical protein